MIAIFLFGLFVLFGVLGLCFIAGIIFGIIRSIILTVREHKARKWEEEQARLRHQHWLNQQWAERQWVQQPQQGWAQQQPPQQ